MRPHRLALPGLLLLALTFLPGTAAAQLRVIPQVGLYGPFDDLPSPGEAVELGERDASLALGAALELGGREGTSFRITALHGTSSGVPVFGVGCTECVRSSVTSLTAAVVVRPLPSLVVLRPYLLLGGGVRRLDFEREDMDEEGFDALFSDQNDVAGHLGIGAEIGLPFFDLDVGLSDVISPLDGPGGERDLQHDIFLTFGLVIG